MPFVCSLFSTCALQTWWLSQIVRNNFLLPYSYSLVVLLNKLSKLYGKSASSSLLHGGIGCPSLLHIPPAWDQVTQPVGIGFLFMFKISLRVRQDYIDVCLEANLYVAFLDQKHDVIHIAA